jgi:choline-sulfatase
MRRIAKGVISALALGLVIGFLFGCFKTCRSLYANGYLGYGMYNLLLFVFHQVVTKWSIFSSILMGIAYVVIISTYSTVKVMVKEEKRSLDVLVAGAASLVFLAVAFYMNHRFFAFGFFTPKGIVYMGIALAFSIALLFFLKSRLLPIRYARARGVLTSCLRLRKSTLTVAVGAGVFLMLLHGGVALYTMGNIPRGPNVLLIVVDTLRPDHLGCYGYKRNISPNIDQLAREGLVFRNCISQAPWTLPSIATLLTSLYPSVHGASDFSRKLSYRLVTLPELFRNQFYETGGIVSGDFVSSQYGFDQGFGYFDEKSICGHKGISSPAISRKAIEFLRRKKDKRFFLFLHYFDPHFNYVQHDKYHYFAEYAGRLHSGQDIGELRRLRRSFSADDIDYLKALYDGEISFTDEYVGLVLKELNRLGLYENTLVIFTADHGEEFMERGWLGHSTTLYAEQINVPLIVKLPGARVRRTVENRVGPIDIMPTVLGICDIDSNGSMCMQGANLQGLVERMGVMDERSIFSEVSYIDEGIRAFKQSAILGQWKITKNMKDDSYELYNVRADQQERRNVADQNKVVVEEMKDLLHEWEKQNRTIIGNDGLHDTITMDEELKSRLRSLGYIN